MLRSVPQWYWLPGANKWITGQLVFRALIFQRSLCISIMYELCKGIPQLRTTVHSDSTEYFTI